MPAEQTSSDHLSSHQQVRTTALNLTHLSMHREEFNEELASLLRNIAEDAKTERATEDDGAVGSRPLSPGNAANGPLSVSVDQPPAESPQPHMSSGGPSKSPAKTPPASSGNAEPSGSPAPDVRPGVLALNQS